jgi:hypothetical protein
MLLIAMRITSMALRSASRGAEKPEDHAEGGRKTTNRSANSAPLVTHD